jgi:hypothetical protein
MRRLPVNEELIASFVDVSELRPQGDPESKMNDTIAAACTAIRALKG